MRREIDYFLNGHSWPTEEAHSEASLSSAVSASAPSNSGAMPNAAPNWSASQRTESVSGPVTFNTRGDWLSARDRRQTELASPCQTLEDRLRDIQQDSVAEIDSIIQTQNGYGRAVCRGEVLQNALPRKRRLRVLTDRRRASAFGRAAAIGRNERINVARR
jgi:hypothetical protein